AGRAYDGGGALGRARARGTAPRGAFRRPRGAPGSVAAERAAGDHGALDPDGDDARGGAAGRARGRRARPRVPAERLVPPAARRGAEERDAPPRRALRGHGPPARGVVRRRRGHAGRRGGDRPDRGGLRLALQGHLRRPRDRGGEVAAMGMDMNKMLQQVQQMQEQVAKAQEELANQTVEASAGGGMVTVVATGGLQIKEIKIAKEAIDPDDPDMLADMVLAAVNEALRSA